MYLLTRDTSIRERLLRPARAVVAAQRRPEQAQAVRLAFIIALAVAGNLAGLRAAESSNRVDQGLDAAWEVLQLPVFNRFAVVRRLRDQLFLAWFPRYPYRDGHRGYAVLQPFFKHDQRLRLWGARVNLDGGLQQRHSLLAVAGEIDSTFRFGGILRLQETWTRRERETDGVAVGTYRLMQFNKTTLRVGFGPRWSNDTERTRFGVDGFVALDVYPRRPWVVSTQVDAGSIGAHVLACGRFDIGYLFRAVDIHVGLLLSSRAPDFHGVIAAMRYWF